MSRLPSFDEEDSLPDKHPLINPNFQNKTNLKDVSLNTPFSREKYFRRVLRLASTFYT